ncbi:MAG: arylsulfatase [Planctomycetota bacterium]
MRLNTYLPAFLLLSVSIIFAKPAEAETTPNIVVIMADDLGPGDVGYYHQLRTGREPFVATPYMDALAKEGMRFSDGHSSTALCSPTRYCAMTGNLNHRSVAPWGIWSSFRPTPVTDDDATLGRVGQMGGLTTGFIGKWHLGGDFMNAAGTEIYRGANHKAKPEQVDVSKMVGSGPQQLGFDYSFTMPAGIQGPLYTAYENGDWYPFSGDSKLVYLDKSNALDPKFVSDKGPGVGDSHWDTRRVGPMLASKAESFIKDQAGQDKPFLLVFWSPMVHIPHLPPKEFNGRLIAGQGPTPHVDIIADFDQQVGAIVEALKAEGVYDNTLIFLCSDNGGLRDGKAEKLGHISFNGLRGSKNQPHEGGHRVPFFAVWPDKIAADSESAQPVANRDIVATIADVLGQTLNENQAMDSLSLLPVLLGEAEDDLDRFLPLQGGSNHELINRRGPWKLIIDSNHPQTEFKKVALFNLYDNPLELEEKNLLTHPDHAERVKEMYDEFMQWRDSGERSTPPMAQSAN